MSGPSPTGQMIHASAVAIDGRGLLILGPSGAGKSGLALQLMALGAMLVADDQTLIRRQDDHLWAAAPARLAGKIEARFIGILAAPHLSCVPLILAVDLGQSESQRLPPARVITFFDLSLPCLHKSDSAHFPAALLHYMKAGRIA
ncbi:MAG: HPr kinase/phosphatase C-terminal domain-containing protein [Rhodobacteraceae bacterium]|nr:HPr kinase/phosphatase C-terminal domain-containing protein [Paracoccaceae bacterium]